MENLVKSLHAALIEKYALTQAGRSPEIAASFALENYLSMYRHCSGKEIYLQQELEDIQAANEKRKCEVA